jgi:hypothetical protein
VLALLAGLLATAQPATAATTRPTFARTDHPSLANSNIAADLNGDGRLDLAGLGARTAAVLLSTGDGTFGARAQFPVADFAQDLAAADLDRDGRTDLVVTINSPNVSLSLLKGNGDGTFQAPVNIANTTGLDSPTVVTTDVNNDGLVDVLVGHAIGCFTAPCKVGRSISVMLGNGDGTFAATREVDVGTGISEIAVGDFNRDGNRDLAISGDSSRLYRLYGRGDGTFVQQPTLTLTADTLGVDATDVDVADFNGDAVQDLVVAIALNGSRTAVLLGNADGTFAAPLILTDSGLNVPQFIAVADYNLDGFQDLAMALANGNSGLMQIRNGNGNGTFQAAVNQQVPPAGSSIGGVAILSAMLNADNKPDIALAWGGASSGMAVLRNTSGAAPPGQTATLSVTATGRRGERVTSTPAGINAAVGSTSSASFPAGTSVTLRVSNGRTAVWSGACFSGGNSARTCTLSLSGNAAVTANVR